MKSNKEMAESLYRVYEESLQRETELLNTSRRFYQKWEASDCEDETAYEEYQRNYEQHVMLQKDTNLIARLIIEYAFDGEGNLRC